MAEICYSLGRIPTEIGRLAGSRPPRFHSLDRCQRFFARLRATCQIAHNLGISIHRVQPIEVVVLEWLEPESCRNQHGHLDTRERSSEIGQPSGGLPSAIVTPTWEDARAPESHPLAQIDTFANRAIHGQI